MRGILGRTVRLGGSLTPPAPGGRSARTRSADCPSRPSGRVAVQQLPERAADPGRGPLDRPSEQVQRRAAAGPGAADAEARVDERLFLGSPARLELAQPLVLEVAATPVEDLAAVLAGRADRAPEEQVVGAQLP